MNNRIGLKEVSKRMRNLSGGQSPGQAASGSGSGSGSGHTARGETWRLDGLVIRARRADGTNYVVAKMFSNSKPGEDSGILGNGQRIVEAVGAHDRLVAERSDLLAALRAIEDYPRSRGALDGVDPASAVMADIARAAIARATKGEL